MTDCQYCREAWVPLFRIVESYVYSEYDVHGECEECERGAGIGETYDMEAVCGNCEMAPIPITNQFNLSIYINGLLGELIFEDKVRLCKKYRKRINYCPMCGRKLEADNG